VHFDGYNKLPCCIGDVVDSVRFVFSMTCSSSNVMWVGISVMVVKMIYIVEANSGMMIFSLNSHPSSPTLSIGYYVYSRVLRLHCAPRFHLCLLMSQIGNFIRGRS
jgi:hypothetical protein